MKKYAGYIAVMAVLPILAVVVCVLLCVSGRTAPMEKLKEDEIYLRALGTLNKWLYSEFAWMTVYVYLSVMPFVCAVIILHLECYYKEPKNAVIVFSIVSLSLMSLMYFLKPNLQGQMFRKAYEVLKPEVLNYECSAQGPGGDGKRMVEAMREGEQYIGSAI